MLYADTNGGAMKKYTSVLIGCGDIGVRLAALLHEHDCTGIRRTPSRLPEGIEGLAADFSDADSLRAALHDREFDYAVLTFTPEAFNEGAYRASYLAGALACIEALNIRRKVFFVSSSSVYGEDQGGWVDEDTPLDAQGFSGRVMAEAEQALLDSTLPACVVRFSGIYGPGRQRLLARVQAGQFSKKLAYTNRIHVDDCAAVLAHLMAMDAQGLDLHTSYLASDDYPVLNLEVEQWLSEQLRQPGPDSAETAAPGGKRCSNKRLRDSGFEFTHSDFRSGYLEMLP
jgi:nucleoside-diphosphate-sugar epimerase